MAGLEGLSPIVQWRKSKQSEREYFGDAIHCRADGEAGGRGYLDVGFPRLIVRPAVSAGDRAPTTRNTCRSIAIRLSRSQR